MNSKKGISLIVLVITIIVIIILAAAVILSLSNNNVLTNSRIAVNANDFSEVQSAWSISLQGVIAKQLDNVVLSGEITSAGFTGMGYAGEKPSTTGTKTLSDVAITAANSITISSMGLPASFTNIAIKDNIVTAIVKNTQLMYKDTDGNLKVMDANFTGTIKGSKYDYNADSPGTAKYLISDKTGAGVDAADKGASTYGAAIPNP